MSNQDRKYTGSGKAVNGYPLINFDICLSDIPKEAIRVSDKNGKKYVDFTIGERKGGEDQYGKTHSVWINDYKPEPKPAQEQEADLPF